MKLNEPYAFNFPEPLARPISGAVVNHDDLVGIPRAVERAADAVQLFVEMAPFIEDGQDHRNVKQRWQVFGHEIGIDPLKSGL